MTSSDEITLREIENVRMKKAFVVLSWPITCLFCFEGRPHPDGDEQDWTWSNGSTGHKIASNYQDASNT
jgi:hypothetical protein